MLGVYKQYLKLRLPPITLILSVLAAITYICLVFSIPQNDQASFTPDRYSIAAAVSRVDYGAATGTAYSAVTAALIKTLDEPLQVALSDIPKQNSDLGSVIPAVTDGNGIGYMLVSTVAMRVFGVHVWGLEFVTVALMAFSAAMFLWRFGSRYATVVVLYFTILSILQFTGYQGADSTAVRAEISLGGIRYFSFVAFIPAFHLCLDFCDWGGGRSRRDYLCLACQTIIFFVAVLVRTSAACLLGAIIIVPLVSAWRSRREGIGLRALRGKAAVSAFSLLLIMAATITSVPRAYFHQGRVGTVVWHRVMTSLGENPAWPFGDLKNEIDCHAVFPEGLVPGDVDHNSQCFWFDYAQKHHIPIATAGTQIYSGSYESAMRSSFFQVMHEYPKDVLETFFYYKPKNLLTNLLDGGRIVFDSYPIISILLFMLAIGIFLIHAATASPTKSVGLRIVSIAVAFVILNIAPLILVWATYWTMNDFVLSCFFCAATILVLAVSAARAALAKNPPARSCQPS